MKKKKCILMFWGIFPIACVRKKKCIYVFLGDFSAEKKKKKICSKSAAETDLGYCPIVL